MTSRAPENMTSIVPEKKRQTINRTSISQPLDQPDPGSFSQLSLPTQQRKRGRRIDSTDASNTKAGRKDSEQGVANPIQQPLPTIPES